MSVVIARFNGATDNTAGTSIIVTWPDLVTRLGIFEQAENKKSIGGWSPVTYRTFCECGEDSCPGLKGHRKNENVLEVYALAFDLDKTPDGNPLSQQDADAALSRLSELGLRYVVHTTHSHSPPDRVALRVVVAISRPVAGHEWERFWLAAVQHIGIHVEPACRNLGRFWFLPSSKPGAEAWSRSVDGAPLDVTAVLAAAAAQPAEPAPSNQSRDYTQRESQFDISAWRALVQRYEPGAKEKRKRSRVFVEITCPWEGEHSSSSPADTATTFGDDGKPTFKCLHSHCEHRHWQDFRAFVDPAYAEWRANGFRATPEWIERQRRENPRPSVRPAPAQRLREQAVEEVEHREDAALEAATSGQPPQDPPSGHDPDPPFKRDDKGKIFHSQENIEVALQALGVTVKYDRFSELELVDGLEGFGPELDDKAMDRLWLKIERTYFFRPAREYFFVAISDIAQSNAFHPVRDYLATLAWDGKDRISTWLRDYAGAADDAYTRAVSRIMLVAAVRRIMRPGCKFDEMPILEGVQGTNKSTGLKVLAVRDEWFADDLPLGADTKRFMEAIQGRWIVEAGELKGMGQGDVAALKAMLSRSVDRARLSYGRKNTVMERRCVIVGTTNETSGYLRDMTGNRRFWPVLVQQFNVEALKRDRDQLWAEAAAREADGESIRLDPSLYADAAIEQSDREVIDPFEILLKDAFGDETGRVWMLDLWKIVGIEPGDATQDQNRRLGSVMQKLGWARSRRRADGDRQYCYLKGGDETPLTVEMDKRLDGRGYRAIVTRRL